MSADDLTKIEWAVAAVLIVAAGWLFSGMISDWVERNMPDIWKDM